MMKRLALPLFLLLVATAALAQKKPNDELGFQPEKLYDFSSVDSVNLFNGNVMLAIPIGQRYRVGPTLSYQLSLNYNSKIWDIETWDCDPESITPCERVHPNLRSNAGLGWRLSLGRLLPPTETSVDHNSLDRYSYIYEGPTGEEYAFAAVADPDAPSTQLAANSSMLRLVKLSDTRRDVEFPNGEVHEFTMLNDIWRLTKMRDRFDNAVMISYSYFLGDNRQETQWVISDTAGRAHVVLFEYHAAMAGGWSHGRSAAIIDLQTIGSLRAVYDLTYQLQQTQGACPSGTLAQVPFLSKVKQPDGTEYELTYRPGTLSGCQEAGLERIRYPTGGTVTYTYQPYYFSDPVDACRNLEWDTYAGVPPLGIETRTIHDGVGPPRVWKYVQRRGPKVEVPNQPYCYKPPPDPPAPPQWGPVHWSRTSVLSPLDGEGKRDRTDHYFNMLEGGSPVDLANPGYLPYGYAQTVGAPPPETRMGPLVVPELEDGHPEDQASNDGFRYLATETFTGCDGEGDCSEGQRLRATYNRFTYGVGFQLITTRIVHEDDLTCGGPCAVTVAYSDLDVGTGNFETTTESSNYPGAKTVTHFTDYLPVTSANTGDKAFPWFTNLYSTKSRTEDGVTAREQYCFNATNGFLKRRRVLAGDIAAANDVLEVYTPSADGHGNVEYAEQYGADRQQLSTGALCTMTLPGSGWYKSKHTYTNGVLASTQLYNRADGELLPFKSRDRDVDPKTGAVIVDRDPSGAATTFTYDAKPLRLTSMTIPAGAVTTYTYTNATGTAGGAFTPAKVSASTDSTAGFPRTDYTFDGLGRVTRQSARGPALDKWFSHAKTYDEMGRLATASQPELTVGANPPTALAATHKTSYLYDAFGRPAQVTAPDGKISTWSYLGARERRSTVSVALMEGREGPATKREIFDQGGRLVSVIEGGDLGGLQASYGYDVGNRLTNVKMQRLGDVTAPLQERKFTYDRRGFLLWEQHPELGSDGNGTTTYLNYDPRGHAERQITGSSDLTMTYDSAERLTEISQTGTNPKKVFKQFIYDTSSACGNECLGKVTSAGRYNYWPGFPAILVVDNYQYGGLGNQISRRDQYATNVAGFEGLSFFHSQTYNNLGLVSTLYYPCRADANVACVSGDRAAPVITPTYSNGYLTAVTPWASEITYQPSGMVDTVTHGSGSTAIKEQWVPDANGLSRPSSIRALDANNTQRWSSGTYEYDGAGNIKKLNGIAYSYDLFNRLAGTTTYGSSGGYLTTGRLYDEFGNHLGGSTHGCGPATGGIANCWSSATTPAAAIVGTTNHYVGQTYDGLGNVIAEGGRSYTYDLLGVTTGATANGRTFRYLYTAADERIAVVERVTGGDDAVRNRTTWTLRGFDNQLLSSWTDDFTSGNRIISWKEDEFWRGSSLIASNSPSGPKHYTLDHLGSPRYITDAQGIEIGTQNFDPFGVGGSADRLLQFTGHERDLAIVGGGGVELPDYFHSRYYLPGLGRFLALDLVLGEPSRPQSWNRYSYVLNNPLSATDPTGLDPCVVSYDGIEEGRPFESDCSTVEADALEYSIGDTAGDFGRETATDVVMSMGFAQALGGMINNDPGEIARGYGKQLLWAVPGAASGATRSLIGSGDVVFGGTTTLFRSVSQAEFEQLMASGVFRAGKGTMEGKWFAETLENAIQWGELLGNPRVVSATLSTKAANALMRLERLDGIGPARWAELSQLMRVTIKRVR